MNKDILNLETRRKIYNYIKKNPGVHFRSISKKLKIRGSTIEYHLRILTRQNLITEMKENGYLRFFVNNAVGNNEKKVLSLLRQKTPRHIVISLLSLCGLSSKELCQLLNKSPSTINFHIKILLKNNIIEKCPITPAGKELVQRSSSMVFIERNIVGREIVYQLKEPYQIKKLIIMHENSLLDGISKEVFATMRNRHCDWYDGKMQKVITTDNSIKRLIESVYDIFPHPYHA
jgi:DNA-binding transcriptional ArsR family regulator